MPHPKTVVIQSAEQLGSLDVEDFAGSFLKPRDSLAFFMLYEVKACRVKSREDAVSHFDRITGDGFEVLFQEYIPGPASNHYFIDGFVDRAGQVCALFARRRLRMYPTDFGNSSYMVSIPVEDVYSAAENLKRLLQEINYRGIFSAEFKFDERDRQFKILEINARPWWFIEFADVCGVDVCKFAYRDALGEKVRPVKSYRTGVRLVHPYFDIHICVNLIKEGKLSIISWIRSWIGAKYTALCFDDPLPAFAWWLKRIWFKVTGQSS
jgi:D-aspartate ligase